MLLTTGSRFGKREIVGKVIPANGKWICRCECGTLRHLTRYALTNRESIQCSECYWGRRVGDTSAFNAVLNDYVQQARRRELFWGLSRDEARALFQASCRFCKRPPFQIKMNKTRSSSFTFNGIDRINSSVGYVLRNCVPCCWTCNWMKRDMSLEDFTEHIARIARGLGICEQNLDAEGADTQNSDTRFP